MAKIRHVSIFKLKDPADASKFKDGLDLLRQRVPGFVRCAYGADAGLKAGNADFGVSFDFADEAAYRKWDTDAEHERIRRELIFPLMSSVTRVQFELDE